MSPELAVVIVFGTLTCVFGVIQLWMSHHQYMFWLKQMKRNRTHSSDEDFPLSDLELGIPSSLRSSGTFVTCYTGSLSAT